MLTRSELEAECKTIDCMYGIKLTWNEKAALSFYIETFREKVWDKDSAAIVFVRDYFGMDEIRLDHAKGMGLLFTDEFKEYCRRRIDMWRQERENI